MDNELLSQGISYYRAKNLVEARRIFIEISKKYPEEELSWTWLAACAPTREAAINCLKKAYEINPTNQKTKGYLIQFGQTDFVQFYEDKIISHKSEENSERVVFSDNLISNNKKFGLKYWVFAFLGVVLLLFIIISFGKKANPPVVNASPTEDWRTYPNYVSEINFGKDWPFKFTEGLVQCYKYGVTIDSIEGEFGLTGSTNSLGFTNIRDSSQWKDGGWMGKVPLSNFTSYAVSLCQ